MGVALIGAAASVIGGAVAAGRAKKAAGTAKNEADRARREISRIKAQRVDITNPYSGNTDLSALAQDLSSMITNPFANLSVATQAANIQIDQSDIALANALDNLATTGASAGGATALAQAALASKKGVSASIETQEKQNEDARAQGEQRMQQMKVAEGGRIQGMQLQEGQRLQTQAGQGNQFQMQMEENRSNADLGRAAGQEQQAMANQAAANAAEGQAWGSAISGVVGAAGSYASSSMAADSAAELAWINQGLDPVTHLEPK